ncbi:hypothetical protein ACLOJK_034985, partial [Asimina triloba]
MGGDDFASDEGDGLVPARYCQQRCLAASPDLGLARRRRRDGRLGLSDGVPEDNDRYYCRDGEDVVDARWRLPEMEGVVAAIDL